MRRIVDVRHKKNKFMPGSEIEYCDIGLSEFYEELDSAEDRVEYEDQRIELWQQISGTEACLEKPFSTEIEVVTKLQSVSANSPTPEGTVTMENIQRYSGIGGGTTQKTFKQDAKAVYNKMMRDHKEHLLVGLCQWEFLKMLGPRLQGEVRAVHVSFMDYWDFENLRNPILEEALDAERRRQMWRNYRRDRAAYLTMRAQSGFQEEPPAPTENEPRDMERFFDDLEARFKSSSTENLTAIQNFKPATNETPERMFARFNMLSKPLEDEQPRVMTRDQLKTTYQYNLNLILAPADAELLNRDVRDSERDRVDRGFDPLTRYEIHEMVLRQLREKVVALTKLRAVGLALPQAAERVGARRQIKEKEEGGQQDPFYSTGPRQPEKEKRTCNNCGVKGHIARNCTNPAATSAPLHERLERKRQPLDAEDKIPTRQRLNLNERLGPPRDATNAARGRGGAGNRMGRPVNPRNVHMTDGVTCSHCGTLNHSAAQCWTLHPELCPFPKKENAMMVEMAREGEQTYKQWEDEQIAREQRAQKYETERELREMQRENEEDETMVENDCQFMAQHVFGDCEMPHFEYQDLFELDDPALEVELLLMEDPISEPPRELRRLQQSADNNGGVATPEEQVESWFCVDGKNKHTPLAKQDKTYANVVKTRFGVTGDVDTPTLRDSMKPRQSPRKRVQIAEGTPTHQAAPNSAPPTRGRIWQRRVQSTTPSPPASPTVRTTRRRTLPLEGGEMFLDDDAAHLPMTFPLKDIGNPTPGTTNLNQPPETARPLPPKSSNPLDTSGSSDDNVPDPEHSEPATKFPITAMNSLCHHLTAVQQTAVRIKSRLYALARADEENAPLPVLMVHETQAE